MAIKPPAGLTRFDVKLTLAYAALLAFLLGHHELWRDEMQAWLLARDSPGLHALLWNVRYEGTPPLWHLSLGLLALLSSRPEWMQVLTWVLASALMFLICTRSPFSRLQKVLLVLNYYLLYQYGTLSRNYIVSLLALTGACVLFCSPKKRPFALAGLLFLASFASVHGWILAVAMACAAWAKDRHTPALSFFLAGAAFSVFMTWPAPDTLFPSAAGWTFSWKLERFQRLCEAFFQSYFYLPDPSMLWESSLWHTLACYRQLAPGLALLTLGTVAFLLRKNREAILFYGIATAGLAGFFYAKYLGFSRHTGFFYFSFLIACWMAIACRKKESKVPAWGGILMTFLLALQAAAGIRLAAADIRHSFSNGKAVAQFLSSQGLQDSFIAAGPDYLGAPIAGYLGRRLYFPQGDRQGSFTRWDYARIESLSDAELLHRTREKAGAARWIAIVDHALSPELQSRFALTEIFSARGALVGDENYRIYQSGL